jgi:Fungal N-terminal domain of STAND proteins
MADPLSVTASVIAVLGAAVNAAQTIQNLIRTLRQAPDELLALSNEVSDFRLVLHEIDLSAQGQDVAYNSTSAILRILSRAEAKLDELDRFVKGFVRPHLSTVTKVDRVRWMKEKNNAQAIQSELRAMRMDLATLLVAKTSYVNF